MTKQSTCTCAKPLPVSPCPPQIHCLICGGLVAYNRHTALQEAIARVEQINSSASLRAAGFAFFLQDLGFDFEEISEYLDEQAQAQGVQG